MPAAKKLLRVVASAATATTSLVSASASTSTSTTWRVKSRPWGPGPDGGNGTDPDDNNNDDRHHHHGGHSGEHHCGDWTIEQTVLVPLGIAGSIALLVLWFAQMHDVWTAADSVWKTQSTRRVATPFPYLGTTFLSLMWVVYAASDPDELALMLAINAAGMVLNASYVWAYWKVASDETRRRMQWQACLLTVYTAIAVAVASAGSLEVIGVFAAVVNTLMLLTPLHPVRGVLQSRNTQGMPLPYFATLLVASLLWLAFGAYSCRDVIIVPNAVGVFVAAVGLLVHLCVARLGRRVDDATTPLTQAVASLEEATSGQSLGQGHGAEAAGYREVD